MQRPDVQDKRPQLFWDLAHVLMMNDSRVHEGTIMGTRCLRVDGEFLALLSGDGQGMVVKLPRTRVADLIAEGLGCEFAPAGRIFGEWVRIPDPDRLFWSQLLSEGLNFIG